MSSAACGPPLKNVPIILKVNYHIRIISDLLYLFCSGNLYLFSIMILHWITSLDFNVPTWEDIGVAILFSVPH